MCENANNEKNLLLCDIMIVLYGTILIYLSIIVLCLVNASEYCEVGEHSIRTAVCQVLPRRPHKTVTRSARDCHEIRHPYKTTRSARDTITRSYSISIS